MNKRQLAAILIPSLMGATAGWSEPSTASTPNISCNTNARVPTVMATVSAQNRTKNVPLLSLLPEYFSGQDAVQNCSHVAQTLQTLYQNEQAAYLVGDRVSDQSVICAVERRGVGCDSYSAQILLTLDQSANPTSALYNMLGSDFKQAQNPTTRTMGRIYTDIQPTSWLELLFR